MGAAGRLKVLITGAGGMFARAAQRELSSREHQVTALDHSQLDVTDTAAVTACLDNLEPDVVLQCAAYTKVDAAEHDQRKAFAVNANATQCIAQLCSERSIRLIYPSTDYVFDGAADRPYRVTDKPAPLNAYGRSKLEGEQATQHAFDGIVVRTSWLYGGGGTNFVASILRKARSGEPLRVVDDQRGAPTWTQTLASGIADLLEQGAPAGIYHLTNSGEATWFQFASEVLSVFGVEAEIEAIDTASLGAPAERPKYSVLDCSGTTVLIGDLLPWEEALRLAARYDFPAES